MSTPDLTTPEGVASYMSNSLTEKEWNKRCNEVKRANSGYPLFWDEVINQSGLHGRTRQRWIALSN
jgi:hypothetical protein